LLAAEASQSVAVVGPTQSGKTSSFAVPAILGWRGPVLAVSVKTDLVRDTYRWRRSCGIVWCFDPTEATGLASSPWSPLRAARTWTGARRVAADLTEVTRTNSSTPDGDFWYATAAKLIAPLLFAAAASGRTMVDVVRWVDTQEVAEVVAALEASGVREAMQAAYASFGRDERQRSAVYTTAETVLEPFAGMASGSLPTRTQMMGSAWSVPDSLHPTGLLGAEPLRDANKAFFGGSPEAWRSGEIRPDLLLDGSNTLYVCAPAHDQRRLRGLFTAIVKQVLEVAFSRSTLLGGPLRPPLLVVLDEAANIAPLAELDGLAATCASHGVQLVTIWQDLAQLSARYGDRAATVINNHRARIFLSGIADGGTLEQASRLLGDEEVEVPSVTRDAAGGRSMTISSHRRRLLSPEALRQLPPGTGVLVYGSLPPVKVALRPWWRDAQLQRRGSYSALSDWHDLGPGGIRGRFGHRRPDRKPERHI